MSFSFSTLNYKQKSLVAEVFYLFLIGVLSPLAIGLQNFSWLSYALSYLLLNMLSLLPAILLFYRVFLPQTIGRRRYVLFFVLLPLYIAVYELNDRLGMLALLRMPFIPEGYKAAIRLAHPERLLSLHFNEFFGYTILVLLSATPLYVIKLLFKNQDNLSTMENEKLKLELNQLKTQLQPHFFFNTINNLYTLSVQNSPQAPKMINDLSGIMRYILYDARNEQVPLQQEVDFIKSYINLENIRHNEKNIVELLVQGNTDGIRIEPLLFLPVIENTFKHALRADMPEKWVRLVLAADEDELIFQAVNPKANEHKTCVENGGGIGLPNIRKRLELLYPGRHELLIHDEAHTFTVILTISLKHD
jgi:two-component system LytT family sensor kinase